MLDRLQQRLGYRFKDVAVLIQALTHRSCGAPHNERLEFLGDGLLNFVIGAAIFQQRPRSDEGDLTRLRAQLVCEDSLAELARQLQLGDVLRLGPGELKSGGYRRDSILADAVEAVLAAVCLDGGYEAARAVCLQVFADKLVRLPETVSVKDAKTRLQEYLQGLARPLPEYRLIEESGPPHQRRFRAECGLSDAEARTVGEGASRKLAEQMAAERMLALLQGGH